MKLVWNAAAACKGLDSAMFYPADDVDAVSAKTVCEGCSVQSQCLEFAIENREKDGVWGGATFRERQRIVRRRRRQRRLQLVNAS